MEKGLPLVCVNPAGIYGPGDRKPTGRFIVSLLNGRVPALFPGWMSLVYIDDAVRGHILAADKGQIGFMVKRLLPTAGDVKADAADALAVAITHAHHR